jgi:hypothetical protein
MTSQNFSSKRLSLDSLKVRERCGLIGTVNLFGGGQPDSHDWARCVGVYIVTATPLISAQTRNVCVLAALCSAAVT